MATVKDVEKEGYIPYPKPVGVEETEKEKEEDRVFKPDVEPVPNLLPA